MGKHERTRRHVRRFGLTALVVVLGVGVWQGVAAATGGKTVKIQHHNANCGRSVGTEAIGSATFSRDGNEVFVDVNLTNAQSFTDYFVELWLVKSNGDCKFLDEMGIVATDGSGVGENELSSEVDPKKHNFFVDVVSEEAVQSVQSIHGSGTGEFDNDSLIVKLGG